MAQRGFLAGYDRRFLSKEAAHWAAEVMAGAGVPCMVVERLWAGMRPSTACPLQAARATPFSTPFGFFTVIRYSVKFYRALCPAAQNDKIEVRQSEPYSYCQFVMGPDHSAFGRARHPFMTGS